MKPISSTLSYRVPRILFFTLLSLFIYMLFVFFSLYLGAVGFSLFGILFFSASMAIALFAADKGEGGGERIKHTTEIYAPISGKIIPLTMVNDETFAEGIMGEGLAVIPSDDRVYAPVSGLIIAFFETHHAITVLSDDGAEVLIHVGKDTVELRGKHFTPFKKAGERVRRGEVLLAFDRAAIADAGYDITTPITVANSARYEIVYEESTNVTAGDKLFTLIER